MNMTNSPKAALSTQGADTANASWWAKQGLKAKATLLAIAIGTVPVALIGGSAYYFSSQSLTTEIANAETAQVKGMADKVNRFMAERYSNIQVLSSLPALTNPKVISVLSRSEKDDLLDRMLKNFGVYDNLSAFDLNGDVIAQSAGKPLPNHKEKSFFKEVIRTGQPFISQPEIAKTTGKLVVQLSAPMRNKATGQIIGVVRARMPVTALDSVASTFSENGEHYHLVDADGKFFVASEKSLVGTFAKDDLPVLAQRQAAKKTGIEYDAKHLVAYAPLSKMDNLPDLKWDAIIDIDKDVVFKPERELALLIVLGSLSAAVAVAVIAARLANQATQPILDSAEAVGKIGKGKLDTRVKVAGTDELAVLGNNINLMAEQIQDSLLEQEKSAKAQLEAQAEVARQQEESAKAQLEAQAEISRQQTEAADAERHRSQVLQMELLDLLQKVGGASEGDLTVRADVSAGEIGIVADFFNSIVESLRDIVSQVKLSADQVNTSVGSNEMAMGQLADQSQVQALQITDTLKSVELMALSIKEVAENARLASQVSGLASRTAESGGETIDRTVESILQLRDTVAETAKKVKRLGESSQQISKVVSLINQIALQTNLLAINASIEAARAGEEGRGFAVVAEEVGALAAQSANATKEIEGIVEAIQRETSEVVDAMENGTTQVVEGTRQVGEAKESLNQIVKVSREIDGLLKSISTATVSQTETSQVVKLLMQQITESSEQTSTTSRQVSSSLQETVAIAQQLQASVETFKVDE